MAIMSNFDRKDFKSRKEDKIIMRIATSRPWERMCSPPSR